MKTKLPLLILLSTTLFNACSMGDDIPQMAYIAKSEATAESVKLYTDTSGVNEIRKIDLNDKPSPYDAKQQDATSYEYLEIEEEQSVTIIPSFSEYIEKENTTTVAFNAADGAIITCNKGSVIKFPANAFEYDDHTTVQGIVAVSTSEYSSKSDFIMAGLTSMSGDNMIESSGMYNITAQANGKNLILKQGKEFTLTLPTENKVYSSTQIFYGSYPITQNPQPVMYWADDFNNFSAYENAVAKYNSAYALIKNQKIITLTTSNVRDRNSVSKEYLPLLNIWVIRPYTSKGNDTITALNERRFFDVANKKTATFSFLKKPFTTEGLYEPMLLLKEWDTLKLIVTIDESGKLIKTKAASASLGQAEINKIENILSNGKRFKMRKEAHDSTANYIIYCIKPGPETITPDLPKNEFTVKQLGMINCDRFLNSGMQLTTMRLDYKEADSTRYYCVFKNINSVMPAYSYAFPNVPINEPVVIVGIRGTKENAKVFIKETEVEGIFRVGEFVAMQPKEMKILLDKMLDQKTTEQASTK